MTRKILYAVLALFIVAAPLAYLNRDRIIDASIRDKLGHQPDMAFLADDGHIRVLLSGRHRRRDGRRGLTGA